MWVRKSDQQIASERRVWCSFGGPLVAFVIFFIGTIALAIQGPRRHVEYWPVTWPQILQSAVAYASFLAIMVYALQILFRRRINFLAIKGRVAICSKCHLLKNTDRNKVCECGGTFENADNWTWIGDPKESE